MLKTISFALGLSLAAATSVHAQTYICKFRGGGSNGTISPEVLVEFDGKGGAQIADRLSKHHGRSPVQAKFVQDNEKQMRVRWRLEDVVSSKGQKATLEWSLVYKKNRNRAHLTFNAFGYPNTETGNGSCALQK